jgi:hypothetical protein
MKHFLALERAPAAVVFKAVLSRSLESFPGTLSN